MRKITTFNQRPFVGHIVSEPGDESRYDYILVQNITLDVFYAVPFKNSFNYPSGLDERNCIDIANSDNIIATRRPSDLLLAILPSHSNINSYTLYEVCCAVAECNEKNLI